MRLDYENIKSIIGDGDFAYGMNEETNTMVYMHRCGDCFSATWETKPHWDVEHIYHEDGTVEELFHWKEEGE